MRFWDCFSCRHCQTRMTVKPLFSLANTGSKGLNGFPVFPLSEVEMKVGSRAGQSFYEEKSGISHMLTIGCNSSVAKSFFFKKCLPLTFPTSIVAVMQCITVFNAGRKINTIVKLDYYYSDIFLGPGCNNSICIHFSIHLHGYQQLHLISLTFLEY